jgi:hypothetical protein
MFMTISLILVTLALGWMVYLHIEGNAVRGAVSNWVRGILGELGIAFDGNPLGTYVLTGSVHGTALKAENYAERAPPGAREDESKKTVCIIELPLAVPDLIVCRTADVDRVMGPLPAVPRTLTGHDDFDKVYSLFVSNTTAVPDAAGSGYRQSGATGALGWAKPPILDRLTDLSLEWMRVRTGACELAFKPFQPTGMVRAVLTCANLSRSATGAAWIPVPARDFSASIDIKEAGSTLLFGPLTGAFWGGVLGAAIAAGSHGPGVETVLCSSASISMICAAFATRALLLRRGIVPRPPHSNDAKDHAHHNAP